MYQIVMLIVLSTVFSIPRDRVLDKRSEITKQVYELTRDVEQLTQKLKQFNLEFQERMDLLTSKEAAPSTRNQ